MGRVTFGRFSEHIRTKLKFEYGIFYHKRISTFAETAVFNEKYLTFVSIFCILSANAETDKNTESND